MKAWLRSCLDPMNLWHRSIALNYWLLRVYKRWLWKPFLETWFSKKYDNGKTVAKPSGTYACLQCGEKKNMALVISNGVEPSFFCSMSCRYQHGLQVTIDSDSEGLRHRSTWGFTFPNNIAEFRPRIFLKFIELSLCWQQSETWENLNANYPEGHLIQTPSLRPPSAYLAVSMGVSLATPLTA
jgi:hypothetical protein